MFTIIIVKERVVVVKEWCFTFLKTALLSVFDGCFGANIWYSNKQLSGFSFAEMTRTVHGATMQKTDVFLIPILIDVYNLCFLNEIKRKKQF